MHRWERLRPWRLLCGKTAVIADIGVGGFAIGQLLKAFVGSHLGDFFKEYEDYVLPLLTENLRMFLAGSGMRNLVPH